MGQTCLWRTVVTKGLNKAEPLWPCRSFQNSCCTCECARNKTQPEHLPCNISSPCFPSERVHRGSKIPADAKSPRVSLIRGPIREELQSTFTWRVNMLLWFLTYEQNVLHYRCSFAYLPTSTPFSVFFSFVDVLHTRCRIALGQLLNVGKPWMHETLLSKLWVIWNSYVSPESKIHIEIKCNPKRWLSESFRHPSRHTTNQDHWYAAFKHPNFIQSGKISFNNKNHSMVSQLDPFSRL